MHTDYILFIHGVNERYEEGYKTKAKEMFDAINRTYARTIGIEG